MVVSNNLDTFVYFMCFDYIREEEGQLLKLKKTFFRKVLTESGPDPPFISFVVQLSKV